MSGPRIIDPNKQHTVGSKMEQLAARLTTIELAIQRLQQNLANLAMQQQFEAAVNIEAFERCGQDLAKIAEEVARKGQEEKEKAEASVTVEEG